MPENLLCPKQKATTSAYREGWDKTFSRWTAEEIEIAWTKAERMAKLLKWYEKNDSNNSPMCPNSLHGHHELLRETKGH